VSLRPLLYMKPGSAAQSLDSGPRRTILPSQPHTQAAGHWANLDRTVPPVLPHRIQTGFSPFWQWTPPTRTQLPHHRVWPRHMLYDFVVWQSLFAEQRLENHPKVIDERDCFRQPSRSHLLRVIRCYGSSDFEPSAPGQPDKTRSTGV
jgi:hypothetical protein